MASLRLSSLDAASVVSAALDVVSVAAVDCVLQRGERRRSGVSVCEGWSNGGVG